MKKNITWRYKIFFPISRRWYKKKGSKHKWLISNQKNDLEGHRHQPTFEWRFLNYYWEESPPKHTDQNRFKHQLRTDILNKISMYNTIRECTTEIVRRCRKQCSQWLVLGQETCARSNQQYETIPEAIISPKYRILKDAKIYLSIWLNSKNQIHW